MRYFRPHSFLFFFLIIISLIQPFYNSITTTSTNSNKFETLIRLTSSSIGHKLNHHLRSSDSNVNTSSHLFASYLIATTTILLSKSQSDICFKSHEQIT